jgi:hypothetical protein
LPIDGGVYYHPDLIEASRHIYKEHWVKIMLAFSIWSKTTNIEETNKNDDNLIFTILGKISK